MESSGGIILAVVMVAMQYCYDNSGCTVAAVSKATAVSSMLSSLESSGGIVLMVVMVAMQYWYDNSGSTVAVVSRIGGGINDGVKDGIKVYTTTAAFMFVVIVL